MNSEEVLRRFAPAEIFAGAAVPQYGGASLINSLIFLLIL
jgi:hypothetical protein